MYDRGDFPFHNANNSDGDDSKPEDEDLYSGGYDSEPEEEDYYAGSFNSEPEEEDQELLVLEDEDEGERTDDQMADYEEEEQFAEYGDDYCYYDEEEIEGEHEGVEIEDYEEEEMTAEFECEEDELYGAEAYYAEDDDYLDEPQPLYAVSGSDEEEETMAEFEGEEDELHEAEANYEEDNDYWDEPLPLYAVSGSSDFSGDGRVFDDGSESDLCMDWNRNKRGRSNESSGSEYCVCCPRGNIYGMSCLKEQLEQPYTQKCPQCDVPCSVGMFRQPYKMQRTTQVEELQQKVESLEAKCAYLEMKDADWLRKEAEWKKREADLQQQLNQHKEAEAGLVKDTIQGDTNERSDLADDSEPTNAPKDEWN